MLLERYGRGPATHINGYTTIDGVYATEGIKICQGVYIDKEIVPSDHKWLWIDKSEKKFLSKNRDDCMPSITRQATSKIPSVRNKFNQLLEEQVKKHKLLEKIQSVHEGGLEKRFLKIGVTLACTAEAEYYTLSQAAHFKVALITIHKLADNLSVKEKKNGKPFPFAERLTGVWH
ncbi:hypothetical protein CTEN210_17722 [Chaetoceros tenuissimus]|uniref:Uncharacterized protein n=1 Tax=Chaetoceros tenuissimus TaxID=426638 RepID=A0AAD3HFC7_9STRA|nr:hypothetical protein CTEN210_17722 [Chaetoceros tenuissimus]